MGRFPFKKNHQFKFSEFSLVEWNASDRFPEFEATCSTTQGMLGETLLCLKMADFLNIFAALEQDGCETSCTILDGNDDVILLAAVACFMRSTSYGINSFSYLAATSWNSLPDHYRTISDFNSFRRQISTGNNNLLKRAANANLGS